MEPLKRLRVFMLTFFTQLKLGGNEIGNVSLVGKRLFNS